MNATSFSQREEIKAWEQEFVPCEHTAGLVQQESKQIKSQGEADQTYDILASVSSISL